MPDIIIADTSCFILLTNIDKLDILQKLYGEVCTTAEVAAEYGEAFPEWVKIKAVNNKAAQIILEMQVDKGEASAIALAIENVNSTIILDDYKARKVAEKLQLKITGTIGIIIKAKIAGIIPSIKPLIQKLYNAGLRLSAEIEDNAIKEAGE